MKTAVNGLLRPAVLLDILAHFTLFATDKKHRRIKLVCRYQQYQAANQIVVGLTIEAIGEARRRFGLARSGYEHIGRREPVDLRERWNVDELDLNAGVLGDLAGGKDFLHGRDSGKGFVPRVRVRCAP